MFGVTPLPSPCHAVQKPTHFICLILKMLQIQPDKDIIIEFIRNEDYKYVRLLGVRVCRLAGTAAPCPVH